jgi:hypothetical protein
MKKPDLIFACELEPDKLIKLFDTEKIIQQLIELKARISLGLLDLSIQRAKVVQKLNRAGIPVTAWLLLPKEEGYWFNLENVGAATRRYGEFKKWTLENNLQWASIGLDIEPDINLVKQITTSRIKGIIELLGRLFSLRRNSAALNTYIALIAQMRIDGHYIESYQIPLVVDEREIGSSILQRTLGIVDLPVDREILMLYSSIAKKHDPGFLWSYASEAQGIGIGSTGGGVVIEGHGELESITAEEYERDLLLAFRHTNQIFIFSLEGCVKQKILEKLLHFNWNADVKIPKRSAFWIGVIRTIAQIFAWIFSHFFILFFAIVLFILLIK